MGSFRFSPGSTDIDNTNTQAIVGSVVSAFPIVVGGTDRSVVITDDNLDTYISTGTQDTGLGYTFNPAQVMSPGATNINIYLTAWVSFSQPLGDPTDFSDLRLGVWHTNPAGPINYLRILHWNDPVPTQYSAQILALTGTGGQSDPVPWTVTNIPNHVFLVRAKAAAVDSPGFNIHETWLDITWDDPAIGPVPTPYQLASGATTSTIRISTAGMSIPDSTPETPTVLTFFYGLTPEIATMSSVVAAIYTGTGTPTAPIITAQVANQFVDVPLEGLTPSSQYFGFATLAQLNLSATSPSMSFVTNKTIAPVFGI